jgi:hypothetical protein
MSCEQDVGSLMAFVAMTFCLGGIVIGIGVSAWVRSRP